MKFTIPKRGSFIVACWPSLLAVIPFAVLLRLQIFALTATCLLLIVAFFSYMMLRRIHYLIKIDGLYLFVQRGVLITTKRQVALSFIFSLLVLQTPLQKLTGTCSVAVRTAGSAFLISGLYFTDAQKLETAVRLAGGSVHV